MTTKFELSAFLPYRLSVAAGRISRDYATRYEKAFGFSIAEWRVLAHLSQEDEVSIRDIHARIDMDKSKASRAASRLEDAGLVAKVLNPSDRRLVCLSLTQKGRETMDEIIPIANAFQAELFQSLGEDLTSFQKAIDKILD
jgi:DNA-binding MarR family transcriptional regulator